MWLWGVSFRLAPSRLPSTTGPENCEIRVPTKIHLYLKPPPSINQTNNGISQSYRLALQEVPVSKLFELISGAAAYLSPIREAHKWPFYLHSEARPNGCSVLRIAIIDRYTNKTVLIIYIIDTLVMSDDDDDEFDTPILFQFHDGETLTCNKYDYHTDLDHSHPIMHSSLVQSLLEDHDENEQLVIPLPALISRDHFVLLYNHVVHHDEALQRVGFRKHSTWGLQDVLSDENYIEWMRDCIYPCLQNHQEYLE